MTGVSLRIYCYSIAKVIFKKVWPYDLWSKNGPPHHISSKLVSQNYIKFDSLEIITYQDLLKRYLSYLEAINNEWFRNSIIFLSFIFYLMKNISRPSSHYVYFINILSACKSPQVYRDIFVFFSLPPGISFISPGGNGSVGGASIRRLRILPQ